MNARVCAGFWLPAEISEHAFDQTTFQAHSSVKNRIRSCPKSCANVAHEEFQIIDLISKSSFSIIGATDRALGAIAVVMRVVSHAAGEGGMGQGRLGVPDNLVVPGREGRVLGLVV